MAASFKEYIEEKYFDKIYYEIKNYLFIYKNSIPFRLKSISTVHQACNNFYLKNK